MPTVRFMRKGITKFRWVTTLAVPTTPTSTEINAGVPMEPQIAAINGLSWANNPIQVPDMASAFVGQIPGEDTTEDTNFELYSLRGGTDSIYSALTKGAIGYIVVAPAGIAGATFAVADKVDVWPAQISSRAKMYTADNEAGRYRVNWALTAAPTEDFALAA
jgi:hypothetical protein